MSTLQAGASSAYMTTRAGGHAASLLRAAATNSDRRANSVYHMKITKTLLLDTLTVVAAVAAVLVVGLRIGQYVLARHNDPTRPRRITQWRQYATTGHREGSGDAKVTIVEYADFLCPYCLRADTVLRMIRREHPADIAVVYRHFPIHKRAFEAAEASECAARAGEFQPMHDRLFDEQDSIGVKPWARFAIESGVRDTATFSRCLNDPSVKRAVETDSSSGQRLGVVATPTFLINDLRIVGFSGPTELADAVAQAWSEAELRQRH